MGSPRVVVDTATGEVVQQLEYDAFGRMLRDTNPGSQPFQLSMPTLQLGVKNVGSEFIRIVWRVIATVIVIFWEAEVAVC